MSDDNSDQKDLNKSRLFFVEVWSKYRAGSVLQPLESLIAGVIIQHTEYHDLLEDNASAIEVDFSADETNPFLHMGMHITIQEQFGADRPSGFRELYEIGLERLGDAHLLEHRIMEYLGEVLWRAQRDQAMPGEMVYLEGVRRIVGFM